MVSLSSSILQLSLRSCPCDTSEALCNFGIMLVVKASCESCVNGR